MTTKRQPIARSPVTQITDEALDIFERMLKVEPYSDAWYRLHNSLNDLFPEVQPWIFPCIESPDAWVEWESVPDARARYDALMAALEARNKARSSRRALGAPGRVGRVPN